MLDVLRSQTLLVDDHPLFRSGLATIVRREPDLELVGEACTPDEAVAFVRTTDVDIAVVDMMLGHTSGVTLTSRLLAARPTCKVLGLSVLDEPTIIASMLRAGASGYALKTQPASEITGAIRAVLGGERYLPPSIPRMTVQDLVTSDDHPLERLTRREREIFDLLIRGMSNDEVAERLYIARRTVETHRQRIMKKLATHTILEMIRVAAKQGALCE
jgi:DNA-binding NarL/FixJ family response regulator